MNTRPILFSTPMVRAILAGTKTQTRRVAKPLPKRVTKRNFDSSAGPYGFPGDRLWVRETWAYGVHALAAARDEDGPFVYAADGTDQGRLCDRWRPSIHMPRRASRILLDITAVRIERLQDISHADAMAEGMALDDAIYDYSRLWEQINGTGSWDANPLVWVIEFQRVEGDEA